MRGGNHSPTKATAKTSPPSYGRGVPASVMEFSLLYDALALYNLSPAELARRRNLRFCDPRNANLPPLANRTRILRMVDFSRRSRSIPGGATPRREELSPPRRPAREKNTLLISDVRTPLDSVSCSSCGSREHRVRIVSSAGSKPTHVLLSHGMGSFKPSSIDIGPWKAGSPFSAPTSPRGISPIEGERDSDRSSPIGLRDRKLPVRSRTAPACPPLARSHPATRSASGKAQSGATRNSVPTRGISTPPRSSKMVPAASPLFRPLPRLYSSSVQ